MIFCYGVIVNQTNEKVRFSAWKKIQIGSKCVSKMIGKAYECVEIVWNRMNSVNTSSVSNIPFKVSFRTIYFTLCSICWAKFSIIIKSNPLENVLPRKWKKSESTTTVIDAPSEEEEKMKMATIEKYIRFAIFGTKIWNVVQVWVQYRNWIL